MKFIKKAILFILTIILITLITTLVVSFNFHKVIVDGVIKETIKENVFLTNYEEPNIIIDDTKSNYTEAVTTNDERINKILQSEEIQGLVEEYLNEIIDAVDDPEKINEIDFENDMIESLKENKETIEQATGVEITDEMISTVREELQEQDVNRVVKQQLQNTTNNMTETEKTVLKGYKFIISTKFKIILSFLILITTILIALIQKSFHKWINTLGMSTIISGIETLVLGLAIQIVVKNVTGFTNFHTKPLYISGGILFIIGMVIVIIYKIVINKITKNKESNIYE